MFEHPSLDLIEVRDNTGNIYWDTKLRNTDMMRGPTTEPWGTPQKIGVCEKESSLSKCEKDLGDG